MESWMKSGCCCSECPTISAILHFLLILLLICSLYFRIQRKQTSKRIEMIAAENDKHKREGVEGIRYFLNASTFNEEDFGSSTSLEARTQILNNITEALVDPNIKIIGLYYSNENVMNTTTALLRKIIRRTYLNKMFDVILEATVTNKPNIKKIQDEIASGLNLNLHEKSTAKRASLLHDSIKMKQKIFVILHGLYSGIDLGKVGIPYGADHSGCKILLTSTSQDVLSNQMHTQKNFML